MSPAQAAEGAPCVNTDSCTLRRWLKAVFLSFFSKVSGRLLLLERDLRKCPPPLLPFVRTTAQPDFLLPPFNGKLSINYLQLPVP